MQAMRERQRQGGQQPGQGGPPQRSPVEEAKRLATALDAISKSVAFLSDAEFV
jgi:hypothetical protein